MVAYTKPSYEHQSRKRLEYKEVCQDAVEGNIRYTHRINSVFRMELLQLVWQKLSKFVENETANSNRERLLLFFIVQP